MSRFFILAILLISLELHDCFRHFKGHTTYVSRTYLSSKSKGKNESKSKDVFKDVTKLIGGLSKGTINKENYNKEVKAKQELYNKQKLAEEYQLKLSTVIGVSLFGFALGLATDLAFIGTVNFLIPPLSLASILGGGIFYALDQNQLPELTDFAKNEIGIPTKDFIEEKKNNIVEFTTLKKQQIKDLPNYIKMIIVQFFEDLKANIKAKVDNKVAEVKQLPNNLKLSAQNKVLETKESFKAGLENVKKIPQNILIGIQNKAKETQEQIAIKTNENIEEIKKNPWTSI